jgi:hypothetical protein
MSTSPGKQREAGVRWDCKLAGRGEGAYGLRLEERTGSRGAGVRWDCKLAGRGEGAYRLRLKERTGSRGAGVRWDCKLAGRGEGAHFHIFLRVVLSNQNLYPSFLQPHVSFGSPQCVGSYQV